MSPVFEANRGRSWFSEKRPMAVESCLILSDRGSEINLGNVLCIGSALSLSHLPTWKCLQ